MEERELTIDEQKALDDLFRLFEKLARDDSSWEDDRKEGESRVK